MPSLRDLQRRFAEALRDDAPPSPGLRVYRNTVRANHRSALGATYPVVRALVGGPFFDTAVDAYADAHPSTSGDLNVYGAEFGEFLAAYPHATHLPYLGDVARLEWALDEAARAADVDVAPQVVIAALKDATAEHGLVLHPSVRLLLSRHPVWRIWHVHQPEHTGDMSVALDEATGHVLVHREPGAIAVEQLPAAEWAFLQAARDGDALGRALERALDVDGDFDLGAVLQARASDATIVGVHA
jgi:hypothetical protein